MAFEITGGEVNDCSSAPELIAQLESFKGQRDLPRQPRKRGGSAKRRGLSAEQTPVRVVRDRSGQQADFQLEKLDALYVGERLRLLIDADAILCTDSAAVYSHFAKAQGITHRQVNPSHGRRVITIGCMVINAAIKFTI
ncbi:hypothetical protein GCM10027514_35920 [Azotobacter armeniacus]